MGYRVRENKQRKEEKMGEFWELKMGAILIAIATLLFLLGQGELLVIMSELLLIPLIFVGIYLFYLTVLK